MLLDQLDLLLDKYKIASRQLGYSITTRHYVELVKIILLGMVYVHI